MLLSRNRQHSRFLRRFVQSLTAIRAGLLSVFFFDRIAAVRFAMVLTRRLRVRAWPLLFLLAGCGAADDGRNRQEVSGKASSDGTPIPMGSISFEPLIAGGVGSGAVIANGVYSIPQESGLPPGKYRVTMTGSNSDGFPVGEGKLPGDEIMPAKPRLVPANWKQEVEVKPDADNVFDFSVQAPAPKSK